MQKEILTRELLLRELRKNYLGNLRFYPLIAILLWALVPLMIWAGVSTLEIASGFALYAEAILICFAAVLLTVFALCFSIQFPLDAAKRLKKVNAADLYVTTDRVIGMETKSRFGFHNNGIGGPEPGDEVEHYLHFSSYGSCLIPTGKQYKWSKEMCMTAQGVYRTTSLGDEFYLVMLEREHIEMIFNKKFFILQDDDMSS